MENAQSLRLCKQRRRGKSGCSKIRQSDFQKNRSFLPATNYFNDPFLQVTNGIAACATPHGPLVTKSEMLADSHYRADRGINCFQAGRCRLPNSYLYDKEIIPRVKKAIEASGRFTQTSWAEGQRRWVWLKGCVRKQSEAEELERLVRALDDVEAVVNDLTVQER